MRGFLVCCLRPLKKAPPAINTNTRRRHCFNRHFQLVPLFGKQPSLSTDGLRSDKLCFEKICRVACENVTALCDVGGSWRGKGGIDFLTKHSSSDKIIQSWQLTLINATALLTLTFVIILGFFSTSNIFLDTILCPNFPLIKTLLPVE